MNNHRHPLTLLALVFVLSGCASHERTIAWPESSFEREPEQESEQDPHPLDAHTGPDETREAREGEMHHLRSLDGHLEAPRRATLARQFSEQEQVRVAIEDLAPAELIHYVFDELLSTNYAVAQSVADLDATISLNISQSMSERELFETVQDALSREDVHIRGDPNLLYFFRETQEDRPRVAIGVGRDDDSLPRESGRIMQVVPLRYGAPDNFRQIVRRTVGGDNVDTWVDQRASAMFLFGPRDQVKRAMEHLRMLDVPPARGAHVALRELTFISPGAFEREISELLAAEDIPIEDTGSGRVNMVPLERIGSVAIFAANRETLDRIETWAKQLDVARQGASRGYFVYSPENSHVADLGETIDRVLDLDGSASGAGDDTNGDPLPGDGPISAELVVDERQNALIFYSTPEAYERILPLVRRLDRMGNQVLLEVTVAEVTLEGRLEQGLEWFLRRSDGSIGTEGGIGVSGDGLSGALQLDSDRLDILFNLFEQEQRVNILSSPRLMVLDGRTASINVGDDVPVITTQATDVDAQSDRIVQDVQFRSTGITLQVTPQVNARGLVAMEISQEVSEAGENVLSGVESPIILQRRIDTEVMTPDGQSIIIGGLIRENDSSTAAKVPWLGDLPLLGYLFRSDSESTNRTELVVIMTPRIMRSGEDLRAVREPFSEGYRHLIPAEAGDDDTARF